ncbi:hypothetical protein NPIL_289841 [Nephila pilipes]|uniref:Uncharacterized protein n=1 Tax=Nephila pilipes TaxID=299642 RepID=A0A8X6PSR2_NEPPI|nr:hypothetical protein NPIL_289841 [Nephila pilipes]
MVKRGGRTVRGQGKVQSATMSPRCWYADIVLFWSPPAQTENPSPKRLIAMQDVIPAPKSLSRDRYMLAPSWGDLISRLPQINMGANLHLAYTVFTDLSC